MAHVRTIDPEDAEGLLARLYRDALGRTGRVFGVLRVQGLQPRVLRSSTNLYLQVMKRDGPLSPLHREMLAVAVSRANACAY